MNLVDLSKSANSDDDKTSFLFSLCDELGFDHASYAAINPLNGSVQGYATYPDEWKVRYAAAGMQHYDPTLHVSMLSIAPVDWRRFERNSKFHNVFAAASDFGISSEGLTIPIRGPYGDRGLLSLSADSTKPDWAKFKRSVIGNLQAAAVHLHDAVLRSNALGNALSSNLSEREIEVLQWAAFGKSYADIADILSISNRTVEVHTRSAREKLGALTTVQAVARAIGMNLIVPG